MYPARALNERDIQILSGIARREEAQRRERFINNMDNWSDRLSKHACMNKAGLVCAGPSLMGLGAGLGTVISPLTGCPYTSVILPAALAPGAGTCVGACTYCGYKTYKAYREIKREEAQELAQAQAQAQAQARTVQNPLAGIRRPPPPLAGIRRPPPPFDIRQVLSGSAKEDSLDTLLDVD